MIRRGGDDEIHEVTGEYVLVNDIKTEIRDVMDHALALGAKCAECETSGECEDEKWLQGFIIGVLVVVAKLGLRLEDVVDADVAATVMGMYSVGGMNIDFGDN